MLHALSPGECIAMSTAFFGDVNLLALLCIGQHVQSWPVYISVYLR